MKTPVMYWLIVVLQFIILVCSGNRVYEMTDCSESEELYCRSRNQYCCGIEICCTQREHSVLRDHGYFSPKFVIMSKMNFWEGGNYFFLFSIEKQ